MTPPPLDPDPLTFQPDECCQWACYEDPGCVCGGCVRNGDWPPRLDDVRARPGVTIPLVLAIFVVVVVVLVVSRLAG